MIYRVPERVDELKLLSAIELLSLIHERRVYHAYMVFAAPDNRQI